MKYAIHLVLYEGAFLDFKNDTAWLEALDVVPRVFRDVYSQTAFCLAKDDAFDDFATVIVGVDTHTAFQNDKGLVLGDMMVDRDNGAHLQGVEETVTLVVEALMEIVVFA